MYAPSAKAPWKKLIRPEPLGLVNSASSMQTLRHTHSSASTSPVTKAILGMSPSPLFLGKRVRGSQTGFFPLVMEHELEQQFEAAEQVDPLALHEPVLILVRSRLVQAVT